jgi:hypothetical protein
MKRTEEIRNELRIKELERMLNARWEVYEKRWRELSKRFDPSHGGIHAAEDERVVRFKDIPWPIDIANPVPVHGGSATTMGGRKPKHVETGKEVTLEDITPKNVEAFLLGGLQVRGTTATRKGRIRSALLRWHPDKLSWLLARVVEEDMDSVRGGLAMIVQFVHDINSK